MQRVIPHAHVKDRLADLAVGLAADCDNTEPGVEEILRAGLPKATGLPFVAFVTYDGKWVDGYAGSTNSDTFLESLAKAEKAPSLQASPAVRKKITGLAARAQREAKKGKWKAVVRAHQTAAKLTGRCAERTELNALMTRARAWAEAQLNSAAKLGATGTDLPTAEKLIKSIKSAFANEPESKDAAKGLKAFKALTKIQKAEAGTRDEPAREKAAARYEGSRWTIIFTGEEEEESEIEGLD